MDDSRKEFEELFTVPNGIQWYEDGQYYHSRGALIVNTERYEALWQGFKACYAMMQDTVKDADKLNEHIERLEQQNMRLEETIKAIDGKCSELKAQLAQFSSEPVGIMGETYATPYTDGYHGNVISKTVIEKHMPLYSRKLS